MHVSLATSVLPDLTHLPLSLQLTECQRIIRWAAAVGFRGVELSPRWLDLAELSDGQLGELERAVVEECLAISGIDVGPCIFTRTNRTAQHLALVRRSIEAAAALKADTVTISLSLPESPVDGHPLLRGCDAADYEHARAAAGVAELASHAAKAGVQISLELREDGIVDTPELCLEMLRRVGARNLGVNPNLGNLVRGGSPAARAWEAALRWLAPHANNWYVANVRGGQPAPLWDGDIDVGRAATIMRSAGYSGWVSVAGESSGGCDMQERSLRYLQGLLAAPAITAGR